MNDTPVVLTLLVLCVLTFLAEQSAGNTLIGWLALWPLDLFGTGPYGESGFHPWQVVTYAFLHGSVLHLGLNLCALWLFGVPLEQRWGPRRFALYYLFCVIGAAVVHLAVAELGLLQGGSAYPVIGASGGVFGLLIGFGMRFPDVMLMPLFPPIPVKALWFALGYGALELVAGVTGSTEGIAHFAHLGGLLTGPVLLRWARWLS
jgi:membrane associated rhomboid family serine protease